MTRTHTWRAALIVILALAWALPLPAAAAGEGVTASDIDAIAADTLAARGGAARAIPVDPRLKFADCPAALTVGDVRGALRIACPGVWHVNVRVQGGASPAAAAAAQGDYFVAVRPILRGAVIGARDLRREAGEIRSTYVLSPDVLIGSAAGRSIPADVPITAAMIKPALKVKKRDTVDIVSNGPGFQVSMAGTARQSGSTGSRIEVVNLSSDKKIRGFVTDSGKIEINR